MRYLLDADWAISFLNGRPKAVELIDRLADEGIALSVIASWGEIYEGLLSRPSPNLYLAQLDEFTSTIDLIVPDREVARYYARIRLHLRSQGLLIADNDLWIAATALAHDLVLVSRDHHFVRVPELRLYQASEQ